MPSRKGFKTSPELIAKYNWWWHENENLSEDAYVDVFTKVGTEIHEQVAVYFYELYQRKHGKYVFGKTWPQLSSFQKGAIARYFKDEEITDRRMGLLKVLSEAIPTIYNLGINSPPQNVSEEDWRKSFMMVIDHLRPLAVKELDSLLPYRKGDWATPLVAYNLNKTKNALLKNFEAWLNSQKKEWPQLNGKNAIKLMPRLEAIDLKQKANIQQSLLSRNYQAALKKIPKDLQDLERINWASIAAAAHEMECLTKGREFVKIEGRELMRAKGRGFVKAKGRELMEAKLHAKKLKLKKKNSL